MLSLTYYANVCRRHLSGINNKQLRETQFKFGFTGNTKLKRSVTRYVNYVDIQSSKFLPKHRDKIKPQLKLSTCDFQLNQIDLHRKQV